MNLIRTSRRNFMKLAIGSSVLSSMGIKCNQNRSRNVSFDLLDKTAGQPVLKREYFQSAVIIHSLDLLQYKRNFILRARSKEGAVGYSVSNNAHMIYLYPLLLQKVIPYFIGKDARDLDELVDGVFVYKSNYKLQGLSLWVCVATVEFALLDMLGQITNKTIGNLIGSVVRKKIAVYRANNYRGKTAEESIEYIIQNVEQTGAKAVKFKIGGRMSKNADDPPGRTEKLIPLVRKTFGDGMTIYADSNGSYTVDKAIEIGQLLQTYNYDFYEEPVPFDWLEETKIVADALNIPIAGGEQESSLHRFRWMIANNCVQIVQPDMFYFGGMIRSMRVASMAKAAGMECIPHISSAGLGYLYMLHFVSAIPNAGLFHEFKGINKKIPIECNTSSLKIENGVVTVPSGSGLGVMLAPDFIKKHQKVNIQF